MKIIEVRDGSIVFEASKNICLSSFVKIINNDKNYVGQITQLKIFGEISIANAKILFLYKDGQLVNYDNTLPTKDARIETFTQEIISNSIKYEKPVIIGKTSENNSNIAVDLSAFNKKTLVSVDSEELNNLLIRNLSKQFANLNLKTIIIDTLGTVKSKKYVAGTDFKLPLDTSSLAFMYESCLSDATGESKATIIEIFKELSEYSESVPFVPFEALKSIVDNMVDKQHIFKLLVLKNKLAKFAKLGYFASNEKEVQNIENILSSDFAVIDLSKLDSLFLNRYLSFIYEKLQNKSNIQVVFEVSNSVSKKNLKHIMSASSIPVTIVTHSKFHYLNDMKNLFDNFILEPTLTNKRIFDIYSSFLNPNKNNVYLVSGEALNYIPLLLNTQIIDDVIEYIPANLEDGNVKLEKENSDTENLESEELLSEEIGDSNKSNNDNKNSEEKLIEEQKNVQEQQEELELEPAEKTESEVNGEKTADQYNKEIEDESIEPAFTEELTITGDEENLIEKHETTLTQKEIYSAIEEKSESVLSDVAENFNDSEKLNLFDEEGEIIIEDPLNQEVSEVDSNLEQENIELSEEDLDDSSDFSDECQVEDTEFPYNEDSDTDLNESDYEQNRDDKSLEYNQTDDMNTLDSEENLLITSEDFAKEASLLKEIEEGYGEEEENEEVESATNVDNNDSEIEIDEEVSSLISQEEDNDDIEELDYNKLNNSHLDIDLSAEPQILPLNGEKEFTKDFDEIIELDPNEAAEDDIIVDMNDDNLDVIDENVEQQIIEDVDKVFTTPPKENDEEDITDSDLDLIDELNNDSQEELSIQDEEIESYGELNELSEENNGAELIEDYQENEKTQLDLSKDENEILERRTSNTPIVPVYEADIPQEDLVVSDPIQQGDAVTHAKYGNGVVEKMIKYGSKTLFAINFENLGRRLLDPTLTEIKRI